MAITIISNSPAETAETAISMARLITTPTTVTISGELGAGKTLFSKAFIPTFLKQEIEVTSPTFTICNIYGEGENTLYHLDLYRLKSPAELEEIGFEDALENTCIIEWPEIAESFLPETRIDVSITFGENENQRKIVIDAKGDAKKFTLS